MEERVSDTMRSKLPDEGLTSSFDTFKNGACLRKLLFKVGPLNQSSSQGQESAERVITWWDPRESRKAKPGVWEPFPVFVQGFGVPQCAYCGYL